MKLPSDVSCHVNKNDPWVNNFVDFLRPLCDNNMLSKERLLEVTGWEPLQTPWGYDLPFCYIFDINQKCYIVLKNKEGEDV